MKIRTACALALACLCFDPQSVAAIGIDASGNLSGSYGLSEEESRFFPGTYFFHKGCEAYKRGDASDAVRLWKLAAHWGQKGAKYNLGIAYYKGLGVSRDIAEGLAWLGLAAERHEPVFQESLDVAWHEATTQDRIVAKQRHAELKSSYGDDFALRRALQRYEEERRSITGSRAGAAGNVLIYAGGSRVARNGAFYLRELEEKADVYFSRTPGTVNVGDLVPLTDESAIPPESR